MSDVPIILGSRSPQRRDLLAHLIRASRIEICPPRDSEEAGFEELLTRDEILNRVTEIATRKVEQVRDQRNSPEAVILCADTTIIATDPDDGAIAVLGQPPKSGWEEVVRRWFRRYYSERAHEAVTAVVISSPAGTRSFQVSTEVRFAAVTEKLLDWYISTGEPCGKAGGYALQGAGSCFVESLKGSPSNVVGLPLRETWRALASLELL